MKYILCGRPQYQTKYCKSKPHDYNNVDISQKYSLHEVSAILMIFQRVSSSLAMLHANHLFPLLSVLGIHKIARKLGIDAAPAMMGWDFHGGYCHPM